MGEPGRPVSIQFDVQMPANPKKFQMRTTRPADDDNLQPDRPARPPTARGHNKSKSGQMSSAIDFNALFREERKRVREQQKRKQESSPAPQPPQAHGETRPGTCNTAIHNSSAEWNLTITPPNAFVPSDSAVVSPIESVYYLQNWLTPEYGMRLKTWLLSLPEQNTSTSTCSNNESKAAAISNPCWTKLRHARRRVALFDGRRGGDRDGIDAAGTGSSNTVLPPPLANIATALVEAGIFAKETPPNHVLVNDYRPSEGIMPHTDGPSYLDRTATISIGGAVVLKFRRRLTTEEIGGMQQYPRLDLLLSGEGSLVVFTGEAYTHYLHSIDDGADMETTTVDCANAEPGFVVKRTHRISLTFRHKYHEAESEGGTGSNA